MKKFVVILILLTSIVAACLVPTLSAYETEIDLESGGITANLPSQGPGIDLELADLAVRYLLDSLIGRDISKYFDGGEIYSERPLNSYGDLWSVVVDNLKWLMNSLRKEIVKSCVWQSKYYVDTEQHYEILFFFGDIDKAAVGSVVRDVIRLDFRMPLYTTGSGWVVEGVLDWSYGDCVVGAQTVSVKSKTYTYNALTGYKSAGRLTEEALTDEYGRPIYSPINNMPTYTLKP